MVNTGKDLGEQCELGFRIQHYVPPQDLSSAQELGTDGCDTPFWPVQPVGLWSFGPVR